MSELPAAILWGGGLCGVLDGLAATISFAIMRVPVMRVWQNVASGALGPKSFEKGWKSGILGLRRAGIPEMDEDFTEVVFRFTGEERMRFLPGLKEQVEAPEEAAAAFSHWKEQMRKRREVPQGFTESLLHGETMDNVDADVLAAIYNPSHPSFFNAYLHGKKHKDLRYFVRARVGAVPQLDSPEEVALINYDPGAMEDGVWYLDHLKAEYVKRVASSNEDRRLFATRRY
jgi:hypothetical protein